MDEEVFYWIGVVYTAILTLGAMSMFLGMVTNALFKRMKGAYKLIELGKAWREHEKRKAHSTEPP